MTGGNISTVLLSGIVGILLGGLVQVSVARYTAFKEGKVIAAAIRAEIVALFSVFDRASWDKEFNRIITSLESPKTGPLEWLLGIKAQPTINDIFTFAVNPKAFQVFDSLCHKIGLLGDLGAQVVTFYVLGKTFFTNIGTLGDLRERMLAKQLLVDRDALLDFTRRVAVLYKDFRAAGNQAATALGAREHQRWFVVFY